ncbi:putative Chemotaxis signal transduction protein [Desulfamplus magnetovallimortis]|uniref:Putative Chemotaxis signal transduction protein n=1 Tax=Desulfamplus magnetovallimortis TaxID=1246637 RepID=A0A1W1HIU4_9BACT|nr:chemotaxis protein CheW [Desulfamplus magnetovallimortis]SLM32282.1 putative Chemotaxis signal transduction protein [Desulfamplus magnetovallimortis]
MESDCVKRNIVDVAIGELKKREERGLLEGSQDALDKKEMIQLVVFRMGDSFCAFPGENVVEILPFGTITPVPGTPERIRGIINVRGTIESVINLHVLLGMEERALSSGTRDKNLNGYNSGYRKMEEKSPPSASRILLGHAGEIRSGILVDRVEDIISVEKNSLGTLVEKNGNFAEFASKGEILLQENYVTLLNMEKIFKSIFKG